MPTRDKTNTISMVHWKHAIAIAALSLSLPAALGAFVPLVYDSEDAAPSLRGREKTEEPCTSDDDCDDATGRCAGTYPNLHCEEKEVLGATCRRRRDCLSGRCKGHLCVEKEDIGGPCSSDKECVSGRCDGFSPNGICKEKEDVGGPCHWDVDCLSDNCGEDYICEEKEDVGGPCRWDNDCLSGKCGEHFICEENALARQAF